MAQDLQAVENLLEYLRIPSVHPNVNYDECVSFIKRQATELGLPVQVVTPVPGKPTVIVTWAGTQPHLSGILLNSHMDVVPVYPDKWTYPPFEARRDAYGNIFARGTQDMKTIGIWYLEAVRRLQKSGVRLRRNVYICFVPDEEIGSKDGMEAFVKTSEFESLNVGFALDESMAFPTKEIIVFYVERSTWTVEVHCPGTPGHGSSSLDNTAAEKVRVILDRAMDFRQKEKDRLKEMGNKLALGHVTTLNVTVLKGGVQGNVVPPEMSVVMDIRVAPTMDHEELVATLNAWCEEAGPGTYIEFHQKGVKESETKLDDDNPWWKTFKVTTDALKLKIVPIICPGGTDARFLRRIGIPALGFSPLNKTEIRLHEHDEYINEKLFLEHIDTYCHLIEALGNLPE